MTVAGELGAVVVEQLLVAVGVAAAAAEQAPVNLRTGTSSTPRATSDQPRVLTALTIMANSGCRSSAMASTELPAMPLTPEANTTGKSH